MKKVAMALVLGLQAVSAQAAAPGAMVSAADPGGIADVLEFAG